MKLIVVPGLSSPYCSNYRLVYGLLLEEGLHRLPGSSPEVVLLPGQTDASGQAQGEFLIPEASTHLRAILEIHSKEDVAVIARSSGCNVVAHLLAEWKSSPVRKAVFWGPPPFWLYHHMFVRNADQHHDNSAKTGVRITPRIAASATPFESLLRETDRRVLICVGTCDEFCPPAFVDYLRLIFKDNPNIEFRPVEGCPHSVTRQHPKARQYADAIFGWLNDSKSGVGPSSPSSS